MIPGIPDIALSIRQPWAHFVVMGWKPVENRTWRKPNPGLSFRGEFAVHAGSGMTRAEYEEGAELAAKLGFNCPPAAELQRGGIVGVARVVDVVKQYESDWFFGPRALVLADARPVDLIPAKGQLGFFKWEPCHPSDLVPPAKWMSPAPAEGQPDLPLLPAHRHRESGQEWPCIVAGVVDLTGAIIAVHRTWLLPDGSDKAPVTPNRKVWPRGFSGGVTWLSRGGSKYGPIDAGRRGETGIVIYGEGIEDGLTAAMGEPSARVAAMLNLYNLAFLADVDCAAGYVVLRDNDWTKPEAVAAFNEGFARLRSFGKPCEWISSPHGKDFNDLAQAEAAARSNHRDKDASR